MRNLLLMFFLALLISCTEDKPKPIDPQRAAIKDKLSNATTKGLMESTLTIEQMIYVHRRIEKIQNIDSLRTWVDSIAPLISKGRHAIDSTAQLVCTWRGYELNSMVKTFNTDSIYSKERLMSYCERFHSQSQKYQNAYLCFFKGNAPTKMPVPEFQQIDPNNAKKTGSHAVYLYMKSKKPYATVHIYDEKKFKYNEGFTF